MKITTPTYYNLFKCTGSSCSDNCCIGWEIDIDKTSLDKYNCVEGEFKQRLHDNISFEETPHFILSKNERCPFLNSENLCDIFINMNEESLCDICTEHPRFHEWFDGLKETGLGLCCEESVRLLLNEPLPITFTSVDSSDCSSVEYDNELFEQIYSARTIMYDIAQNVTTPLNLRLSLLLAMGYDLQNYIDEGYGDIKTILSNYQTPTFLQDTCKEFEEFSDKKELNTQLKCDMLSMYQELESFDPNWANHLQDVKDLLLSENCCTTFDEDFTKILVSFIYRYVLKSVFDQNVLAKIKLCISSILVLQMLYFFEQNKKLNLNIKARIDVIKAYSKEVEYSDDNIECLYEAFDFDDLFGYENMLTLIMGTNF